MYIIIMNNITIIVKVFLTTFVTLIHIILSSKILSINKFVFKSMKKTLVVYCIGPSK